MTCNLTPRSTRKATFDLHSRRIMDLTQHIDADHLTTDMVDYIKRLFKGQRIKITVEAEPDETAYLLNGEANAKRLLKAVNNIKRRKDLRAVDLKELAGRK